jgi:acetyl-CoA carboxylase beta subunit
VLFHLGSGRGKCPKNAAGHMARGFEFSLDYSDGCVNDTPEKQGNWRKCSKCFAMYWGKATPDSMKCAADGGRHAPARDRCFNLPVNRLNAAPKNREGKHAQGAWRFCGRCTAMFYDGYLDNKGVCPRGGAHAALGDTFVLRH